MTIKNSKLTIDPDTGSILLIDKPLHWTSFDVVNKVRNILRRQFGGKKVKVGHAGTLDPLATGLLILCVGKMTKRIEEFQDMEKEYTGVIRLGEKTPSLDAETAVTETRSLEGLTEQEVREKASNFEGAFRQVPPAYSAKHIKGKRAYQKAREETPVLPDPVTVRVDCFEITRVAFPDVHFRVACWKGTYIRSLARDLGDALGVGGYLNQLRRTCIGPYSVADAWSMGAFEQSARDAR